MINESISLIRFMVLVFYNIISIYIGTKDFRCEYLSIGDTFVTQHDMPNIKNIFTTAA